MRITYTTLFKFSRRLVNTALILCFLAYAAQWLDISLIERLEHIAYDLRLRATIPNSVDSRIVIIDIDEKSISQEGRWPWSRNKLAQLTDKLFDDYRIDLLAFDVVFSEPDNSSGIEALKQLAEGELAGNQAYQHAFAGLSQKLAYDDIFAASLKNRPVVLGYFTQHKQESIGHDNKPPPPLATAGEFAGLLPSAGSFGANLRALQEAAGIGGFFNNPMVDRDGIYRRLPLLIEYQSSLYDALSLAIYRRYRAIREVEFLTDQLGDQDLASLEGIRVGDYTIPTDQHSAILVPYRGRQGSFPYVSATDVLQGQVDRAALAGKIAIVGTTSAGLMDLRSTPVQNVYPGVEIHANIVSALLDQSIKSKPAYLIGFEVLELLVLGLICTFFWPRLSFSGSFMLYFGFSLLVIAVNFALWTKLHIDSALFTPLLLLSSLFVAQVSFAYFLETRRKTQLGKSFSQYVPPELVDQMVQSEDDFSLAGESREMTVLFTDVRGFTSISEGLEPQALSELMNLILTAITKVIHRHQGTIDKYMGDAVMAFWGAPLHDPRHGEHALEAALAILPAITELNQQLKAKDWPEIAIGIGINTGKMSVGNMGSSFRMAYTVLGDAVNLGSRLEGLTKEYGALIIVSDATREQAPQFLYRELDIVRVKGKREPITIYEPLCLTDAADAALIEQLQLNRRALTVYRQADWETAAELFAQLHRSNPSVWLYRLYLERIEHYRETPPPIDWDGVYTHTSK
ncbi:MAG: adenylate/guanylate cyclase domain-containing protein [Proteobacteria bacterium ST_bin11]|nr:MAG: adenylate/guanylate cyclase domain-containing protein [Proteobacteria bacterium ST_bin11]